MRRTLARVGFASFLALVPVPAAAQPAHVPQVQAPLAQSLTGSARDAYASAQILFNNGDFAGALTKYGQAYDLSKDPRLLFNMAVCARTLHAYARMQALLTQFRREAGATISPRDRDDVDAALAAIRNLVGSVRLTISEPDAAIAIDGEPVGQSPLSDPLVLDLGKHTVTVSKPGFASASRTVTIAGGSEAAVDVALVAHRPVAELAVAAEEGATIVIDGQVTALGRFDGPLPAGPHQVRVTEPGKLPYEAEADLRDGETRTMQVSLESEKHGRPVWPWIVGGAVVAAGAAVGGYFLFRSQPAAPATPPDQLGQLQLSSWIR